MIEMTLMMQMMLFLLVSISLTNGQETCPRCTPLCLNGDGTNKTCGDNGCGGSCGTCAFGQECCRGSCVCSPNCAGRQCGDDGCGGTACGTCSSSQTCSNGICIGTATPDCTGRQCGSNRAGGSCGSCPTGQRCRTGVCECYYDCNERNCGNAVQVEGTNFGLCPQRLCGTCPTGFTCSTNGRCSAQTPCAVTLRVVDCTSRIGVSVSSTVLITSSSSSFLSYSTSLIVPSSSTASWSTPGSGTFIFQTSGSGYLTNTQTFNITSTTTSVELCMNLAQIQIDVRNSFTNTSIEVPATITYSGISSGTLRWTGISTFNHGGFGTYTFNATPDSKYSSSSLVTQITSSTTIVIIYVQPLAISVTVVECSSSRSISSTATVIITSMTTTTTTYSTTLVVSPGASSLWSFPNYGTFQFQTSASGYETNIVSQQINTGTTSVQLCLSTPLIQVDVRYGATNVSIEVPATISFSGTSSGTFRWNGLTVFNHGGFGSYSFVATPDSRYSTSSNMTTQVNSLTTLIIIYVAQCGDNICHYGETNNTCSVDCYVIAFDFSDSISNSPVSGVRCNYYSQSPRYSNPTLGPIKDVNIQPIWSRIPSTGSNVVRQNNITLGSYIYVEAIHSSYITFYWELNTTIYNYRRGGQEYFLRVHLSKKLTTSDHKYRLVNSWLPVGTFPFYSLDWDVPVDLNTHVFLEIGPVDYLNPQLPPGSPFNGQTQTGYSQTDVNQSGGPATIDLSPNPNQKVIVWNTKPPHGELEQYLTQDSPLVASGSYFVLYGKTNDAPTGKQLAEVTIDSVIESNFTYNNGAEDLWYVMQFTVQSSDDDFPHIEKVNRLKQSTIISGDMFFSCEEFSHCFNYKVPFADAGKRNSMN